MPGGILISIVSFRRTRPSPPQVRHATPIFPAPPQREHATLKRILPLVCVTWPVPPHVVQTCGGPAAPEPLQVGQLSSLVIVIFLTVPRTASQHPMFVWYS